MDLDLFIWSVPVNFSLAAAGGDLSRIGEMVFSVVRLSDLLLNKY